VHQPRADPLAPGVDQVVLDQLDELDVGSRSSASKRARKEVASKRTLTAGSI